MKRNPITFLNWYIVIWFLGLVFSIFAGHILKIDAPAKYFSLTGAALALYITCKELFNSSPRTLTVWQRITHAVDVLANRDQSGSPAKVTAMWSGIFLSTAAIFSFLHTSTTQSASHISVLQPPGRTPTLNLHLRVSPAWIAAIGTVSAVIVALWQILRQQKESASRLYFEKAETALRTAVDDFLAKTTKEGRPLNDRRHWLNFARGIGTAQELASKIKTRELEDIWKRTEHYWRERSYDALSPLNDSFPAEYYGYTEPGQRIKNFAYSPQDWAPLPEAALVFVYRWIKWPEGYPDSLNRDMKFTEDEITLMESFGPRGLAQYIRIIRNPQPPVPQGN